MDGTQTCSWPRECATVADSELQSDPNPSTSHSPITHPNVVVASWELSVPSKSLSAANTCSVSGLGSRVWGVGFISEGLGFRNQGVGLGVWAWAQPVLKTKSSPLSEISRCTCKPTLQPSEANLPSPIPQSAKKFARKEKCLVQICLLTRPRKVHFGGLVEPCSPPSLSGVSRHNHAPNRNNLCMPRAKNNVLVPGPFPFTYVPESRPELARVFNWKG